MFYRLTLTAVCVSTLLVVMPAFVIAQDKSEIDTFFQLSGLEQQIRELPEIITEQFNDEKDLLTPASQRTVLSIISTAFEPNQLVNDARKFLEQSENARFITEINAWLESDLTKKMNDLEMASNEDATFQQRDQFFNSLDDNMPSESRLELVNRLESSTEATYYLVSVITDMYLSLIKIMSPYMPPDNQIAASRYPELRNTIMNELMPMYRNITLAMNLYTYRDVSDEELEQYVSFYETEAGRWFADVSYEVIDHVLGEARNRIN